jgi:hypothetical protein
VLVGNNAEGIIMKSKRDVLLLCYTYDDPYYKKLIGEFEALALRYRNDSKLMLAKIERNENDLPYHVSLNLHDLKTRIMYFPHEDKAKVKLVDLSVVTVDELDDTVEEFMYRPPPEEEEEVVPDPAPEQEANSEQEVS